MSIKSTTTLDILKKKHTIIPRIIQQRWLFFMLIPGVIWMIIFNYIPMYGIIIAFKDLQ